MKKMRTPERFAVLDVDAVGSAEYLADIGVLAALLFHPADSDLTVEKLTGLYGEGRRVITASMRRLVASGYVVKLKIQSSGSGHWRTEFAASGAVLTKEIVQGLIDSVGDFRALRVEPEWLDPRK